MRLRKACLKHSSSSCVTAANAPGPYVRPSATADWATLQATTFDALHAEFDFALDPCASASNHKCPAYFTAAQNGLVQDWGAETAFCSRRTVAISPTGWRRLAAPL
ncbi:MAG: DNA N-6-adenine-methyltransferase [bacterium]